MESIFLGRGHRCLCKIPYIRMCKEPVSGNLYYRVREPFLEGLYCTADVEGSEGQKGNVVHSPEYHWHPWRESLGMIVRQDPPAETYTLLTCLRRAKHVFQLGQVGMRCPNSLFSEDRSVPPAPRSLTCLVANHGCSQFASSSGALPAVHY